MDNKTLYLAVLAQAVYDALLDLEYPDPESGEKAEHLDSAWVFLSGHAKILRRIRKLTKRERRVWMEQIEKVLHE